LYQEGHYSECRVDGSTPGRRVTPPTAPDRLPCHPEKIRLHRKGPPFIIEAGHIPEIGCNCISIGAQDFRIIEKGAKRFFGRNEGHKKGIRRQYASAAERSWASRRGGACSIIRGLGVAMTADEVLNRYRQTNASSWSIKPTSKKRTTMIMSDWFPHLSDLYEDASGKDHG
jgi:hypothetical protein